MTVERNTMTHQEFFKLCEELRNHREFLTDQQWPQPRAAEWLSEKLKRKVSINSLVQAQKCTGITWAAKRTKMPDAETKKLRLRTIARAILDLYEKLGEAPYPMLLEEYKAIVGDDPPGKILHPSQTCEPKTQARTSNGTFHSDVSVCPEEK